MSHVSKKFGQFAYFDAQLRHPEWQGKYVLDFGGNSGNILKTPERAIDESRYWCLDVSLDGIEEGRRAFPDAHWILYDRYNISFNPGGLRSLPIPPMAQRFDFILAYSVFNHVDVDEMDDLTGQLMQLLKPGGAFAFSFIDPFFRSWPDEYKGTNLDWRLDRLCESPDAPRSRLIEKASACNWFRLAGDDSRLALFSEDEPMAEPSLYEGRQYHVFHTAEFMRRHFPGGEILPPATQEMQHCCVLRALCTEGESETGLTSNRE
jgi:SAM-dependent methyltransferase